jgi:hypothetical protein
VALPQLILKVWQGRLGMAISYYWEYTRFDALRAFKSLFGMFGKGVWRWSFPITIPIRNIGETHFGDLRAF